MDANQDRKEAYFLCYYEQGLPRWKGDNIPLRQRRWRSMLRCARAMRYRSLAETKRESTKNKPGVLGQLLVPRQISTRSTARRRGKRVPRPGRGAHDADAAAFEAAMAGQVGGSSRLGTAACSMQRTA
jgi:hypothetical protein